MALILKHNQIRRLLALLVKFLLLCHNSGLSMCLSNGMSLVKVSWSFLLHKC